MKRFLILVLLLVITLVNVSAKDAPSIYVTCGYGDKSIISIKDLFNSAAALLGPKISIGGYIPVSRNKRFGLDLGADVLLGNQLGITDGNGFRSVELTPNFKGSILARYNVGNADSRFRFIPAIGLSFGNSKYTNDYSGFTLGINERLGIAVDLSKSLYFTFDILSVVYVADKGKFYENSISAEVSANVGLGFYLQ